MAPLLLPEPVFTREPFFHALSGPRCSMATQLIGPLERSMRSVLARYGAEDLTGQALLPSYRCVRRRRPYEEDQAVAVTQHADAFKVNRHIMFLFPNQVCCISLIKTWRNVRCSIIISNLLKYQYKLQLNNIYYLCVKYINGHALLRSLLLKWPLQQW